MEFSEIIKASEKRVNRLKILTNFFNQGYLVSILVRTKVIHDVFASNETLDVNKLELFHLQYTDSVLELLTKLKKQKEQKYLLITNEIQINNDIIASFHDEMSANIMPSEIQKHNAVMQRNLEQFYRDLAYDNDSASVFNLDEMNIFGDTSGLEYFRKITPEQYNALHELGSHPVYEKYNLSIEKKLLGKLNIQNFKFKFKCGLQYNNLFIEVYEFIHLNEWFVFLKEKKEICFLEKEHFSSIDFSKNTSNKNEIIRELNVKNSALKNKAEKTLKTIKVDVETVLKSYLDKISGIEFLDDLQNVDEQTNILRTMLNINIK